MVDGGWWISTTVEPVGADNCLLPGPPGQWLPPMAPTWVPTKWVLGYNGTSWTPTNRCTKPRLGSLQHARKRPGNGPLPSSVCNGGGMDTEIECQRTVRRAHHLTCGPSDSTSFALQHASSIIGGCLWVSSDAGRGFASQSNSHACPHATSK
jgi:hypothetical protein